MLNEEKLKLMTYLAKEEKKSTLQKSILIVRTYRSDYLIKNGILSFITGTMLFAVFFMIYALRHLEKVSLAIFTDGFMTFFSELMLKYAVFILIYLGINIIVYNIKYSISYDRFMNYRRFQKELLRLNTQEDIDDNKAT